jgi:hypothetical protein
MLEHPPLAAPCVQENSQYGCFHPMRDICVPPAVDNSAALVARAYDNTSSPYYNTSLINTTLFFAGGSRLIVQAAWHEGLLPVPCTTCSTAGLVPGMDCLHTLALAPAAQVKHSATCHARLAC